MEARYANMQQAVGGAPQYEKRDESAMEVGPWAAPAPRASKAS